MTKFIIKTTLITVLTSVLTVTAESTNGHPVPDVVASQTSTKHLNSKEQKIVHQLENYANKHHASALQTKHYLIFNLKLSSSAVNHAIKYESQLYWFKQARARFKAYQKQDSTLTDQQIKNKLVNVDKFTTQQAQAANNNGFNSFV